MTDSRKQTLARLIDLASEGNRHAVPALNQVLDLTSDRKERQHVVNAIRKAEKALAKFERAQSAANMTDAELDRLTERCMNGDPDAEADYDRLTRAAVERGPVAPAPSFLNTFFSPDAETARRWEIVKNAK